MKKLHRIISFVLVLCLVLCSAPMGASAVPSDFVGLALSYDEGVSLKLYSGFDDTTVIEPTYTEGNTKYYADLPSGKYRAYATRSGYITMSENIYISAAEAKTRMDKHYSLVKRDKAWDPSYVRKLTDEALTSLPSDPALWPEYATAFTTPVFEDGRTMHKFTTQIEMETFLAGLDSKDDKMYIFSAGTTTGTPSFDIPLVIFTETDLSGAKNIEEAAALLEANGKLTVHYQGQIHGNEPAGGEAALGMIAMLDTAYGDKLLDKMNIYVIPRLNPDGAYSNQRTIPTASVDPNRDYMNLDSYEVGRQIYVMNLFNPEVVVDGHEYTVDLDTTVLALMDVKIHSERSVYATDDLIKQADNVASALFANMEANDLTYGWYNHYVTGTSSNIGTSYFMQRGCISVLLESHGIHAGTYNMARRVASQVISMDGILQYLYENTEDVNKAVNDQWDILTQNGKTYGDGDQITLSAAYQYSPEHNVPNKKINLATGVITATQYDAKTVGTVRRSRENPTAYLVPADHENIDYILSHVAAHGLSYYKIPANSAVMVQHVGGDTTEAVITEEQYTVFANGAYVFQMDQRYARILAFLMEPDVTLNATYSSSFAQSGVFISTNGEYPVYRYARNLNEESKIDYTTVPGAPENLTTVIPTDGANGSISGLDPNVLYEYRQESETTYTALPAGTTQITDLAEGKYFIRVQASTTNSAGADAVVSLYRSITVYLDQANGSDNNDGLTEATAVATLNKAYTMLIDRVIGDTTGTIVFVNEYRLTEKINTLPGHTFPVILTSKTGAEGLNYTYNSASNGEINLNGPTTFQKITISSNAKDNYTYLTAGGHKLVIESDVVTAGAKKFMLVGGRKDGTSTNSDMTVRAGTFDVIYLATHKGSHNGPIQFTMTGGKANSYITPSYSGTVTGDINIYAEGANLGGIYLGNTSKGNVNGNITATLGKGISCKTFYAGSRDSGNVNGIVTLIADGMDIGTYPINGKAKNSTGTIGGLKLVLNQGELADIAESFITRDGVDIVLGCDQIDTAKLNYNCNLDLNGCDVDVVMASGKTLTVWDSATDDYTVQDTQGYGILSATGTVVARDGYKVRTETGGYSYHRWDFALEKVTLRTSNAGIYYVGQFGLNELFQAEVESYGVVLSLNTNPALDKEDCLYTCLTDWPAGGKGNGSVLSGIMDTDNSDATNAANAEQVVYGVAYIKYKDGTVIYSNYVRITLKALIEQIDTSWNSLTQAQKDGLSGMYEQFSAVMTDWNIPNIKATV